MDERRVVIVQTSRAQAEAEYARALAFVALYMACRRCGATMERGTQCKRCGAWCR